MTAYRVQDGRFYDYKPPIETKCGIKSRTRRGHAYCTNWWSRRWLEVLTRFIDPGRLTRGKSYARRGQVVDISIESGLVTAFVQGSRSKPYQLRLGFETINDEARELLLFRLRESAAVAAKLLAGEMPEEIEAAFKDVKTPLFPTSDALRRFKCSCPDDAMPCKHIIAVLLLLSEELDEDPFILLKLRGLDKESLIDMLTLENTAAEDDAPEVGEWQDECELTGGTEDEKCASVVEAPLTVDENWFAGGDFVFERDEQEVRRRAAAFDVMSEFPFWRGEYTFTQPLMPLYEQAAIAAGEILTGEKKKQIGRPRKLI